MTCASCVRHVERALEKTPGVRDAAVNLATEQATIRFDPNDISPKGLVEVIESAGYRCASFDHFVASWRNDLRELCTSCRERNCECRWSAGGLSQSRHRVGVVTGITGALDRSAIESAIVKAGYSVGTTEVQSSEEAYDELTARRERELLTIQRKAVAALAVSAVLMLLMYWPDWLLGGQPIESMSTLFIVMFALATPIQFWAGAQFYRQAWAAARHGQTNMNTLVALGTSAAYLYSAAVTFFPEQILGPHPMPEVYYETATVIIGLDFDRSLAGSAGQDSHLFRDRVADGSLASNSASRSRRPGGRGSSRSGSCQVI